MSHLNSFILFRGLSKKSHQVDFAAFDEQSVSKTAHDIFGSDGVFHKDIPSAPYRVSKGTKKKRRRRDTGGGVTPSEETKSVESSANLKPFFALPDIIDMLGHRDRTLHILKVDVEGCEVCNGFVILNAGRVHCFVSGLWIDAQSILFSEFVN
jgi:hypothetical protein